MRLRLRDVERTGPAIDARALDSDAQRLLAEIRNPHSDVVTCPAPKPVFEHVDHVEPTTRVSRRTAVAAAARSRGQESSLDDEIRECNRELATFDVPAADVPAAVEAVADAAADVDSLRDRVARLGGVVAASDTDPEGVAAAQSSLRDAAAELAAAETTHHAARQELARVRDRQRAANDARERRLTIEDRLANLQRAARRELVERNVDRTRRALDAIPAWPGATDDARLALAVARNAAVRAPIVVEDGPFRTPGQARACLAAPVVLI